MKLRRIASTAVLLLLCFVAGAVIRTVYPPRVEPQEARLAYLVRELVSELRAEGLVDLERDQIMEFASQNLSELATVFEQHKDRYFQQELEIKSLIENNYQRDELEKIAANTEDIDSLVFACPEYDGRIVPVPLDPADWPDIFPRGRFGYEPRDALKEHIYEHYFCGQDSNGVRTRARS